MNTFKSRNSLTVLGEGLRSLSRVKHLILTAKNRYCCQAEIVKNSVLLDRPYRQIYTGQAEPEGVGAGANPPHPPMFRSNYENKSRNLFCCEKKATEIFSETRKWLSTLAYFRFAIVCTTVDCFFEISYSPCEGKKS